MQCEVWLATSVSYFIHVLIGESQQGWHTFLCMLKSFDKNSESFAHQRNPNLGSISAQIIKNAPVPHKSNAFTVSYAE